MRFPLFVFLLVMSVAAAAQRSGELEWQKGKIPATVVDVPFSASITEAAILQRLAQLGYKPKKTKGVYYLTGVRLPELGEETVDLYFMVERKRGKGRDESEVYLSVSKGYQNYVKRQEEPVMAGKIDNYASNFTVWAEAEALERDIKDQEEAIKDAERKASNLQSESESLQRQKQKLERDMEENKNNIEKQKAEVERQRKALEVLKGKRKQ